MEKRNHQVSVVSGKGSANKMYALLTNEKEGLAWGRVYSNQLYWSAVFLKVKVKMIRLKISRFYRSKEPAGDLWFGLWLGSRKINRF